MGERHAERQKQKKRTAMAWLGIILAEVAVALVPAAVLATILLPYVYEERGYIAMGGEWLLIATVFCGAFSAIHHRLCDRIFEEA